MSDQNTMPKVTGRCPACGGDSLFLAHGGHITCSRAACPDPGVVADLLDRPREHYVDLREDDWAIQHAITCFPDLLDCHLHHEFSGWMAMLHQPPREPGRYRLDDDLTLTPVGASKQPLEASDE